MVLHRDMSRMVTVRWGSERAGAIPHPLPTRNTFRIYYLAIYHPETISPRIQMRDTFFVRTYNEHCGRFAGNGHCRRSRLFESEQSSIPRGSTCSCTSRCITKYSLCVPLSDQIREFPFCSFTRLACGFRVVINAPRTLTCATVTDVHQRASSALFITLCQCE
jgi:hypothetical protein